MTEMTQHINHRRTPTLQQLRQERALALAIWLDWLLLVPYCTVAVAVGSLAMIAEILRGLPLMILVVFSLYTLRRIHRGLIADYDYGIGKLERSLSGLAAMLLLFAAAFVTWRAFVMKPEAPPSSVLALVAIVSVCINLGVNAAPVIPLWRSLRGQPSVIVLSHFRARLAKALASLIIVASVTIHSLSSEPMAGRIAEAVGGIVQAGLMIVVAVGLLRDALPDLLDRAIGEPIQMQVNRTLVAFFHDYDQMIRVRTRRSGNVAHVEITLGFASGKKLGETWEVIARMREHLQQAIPNSDIVIVPWAAEGRTPGTICRNAANPAPLYT
jgi:divalent metal cation (Fe/Co/Zn/Cd) transporter